MHEIFASAPPLSFGFTGHVNDETVVLDVDAAGGMAGVWGPLMMDVLFPQGMAGIRSTLEGELGADLAYLNSLEVLWNEKGEELYGMLNASESLSVMLDGKLERLLAEKTPSLQGLENLFKGPALSY